MSLIAPALGVLGFLLIILSTLMILPTLLTLDDAVNLNAFTTSATMSFMAGVILFSLFRENMRSPNPRKLFLITGLCWIGVSAFSALPLYFSGLGLSPTDAFFEAVSGVTTTGSTVMTSLDTTPRAILLWRSLMQWVGGLGFIGMAVSILPFLRVGAMRLFQTESSDWSSKAVARDSHQLRYILLIYLLLTILCAGYYILFGMSWFEAVNHAMTTISTGGYSTSDASIGHFPSPMIQWGAVVFMLLGGLPFTLYIHLLITRQRSVSLDEQILAYFTIIIVSGLALTAYLMIETDAGFSAALTKAFVNATSIITTTGYASDDYGTWGNGAMALFFFLMFSGGCSGSTSGGVKIFRLQLLVLFFREQIIRSVHPKAVVALKYNRQPVGSDVIGSLIGFLCMATITVALLAIGLGATGLDLVTSLSASVTAVMNVGPGLGDIVGPAGNFQSLTEPAKWLLCAGMLAGRLEFLTLIVLLTPSFWRD